MMGAMETFTIGQTAKRAGVKVATLRYYERRRLLAPPARRRSGYVHGGYRIYTDVDVDRIRFIRNAQKLGFSLKEIAELLALRSDGTAHRADVKNKTEAKLDDVRRKIRSLRKLESVLADLVDHCAAERPSRTNRQSYVHNADSNRRIRCLRIVVNFFSTAHIVKRLCGQRTATAASFVRMATPNAHLCNKRR